MDVIVSGSIGYDYIMDYDGKFADRIMPDKIHSLSLGFLVDKLEKQFGGTSPNIAYTLKLLGIEPHIIGCAGNDFGPYGEFLRHHHIDISSVHLHKDMLTGCYFVTTDKDDNQIGSFYTGPIRHSATLKIQDMIEQIPKLGHARLFAMLAPTDPKAMMNHLRECKTLSIPYCFDPAFQISQFSKGELLEGISSAALLIGNDYEISLMKEQTGLTHEALLTLSSVVITTLGNKGSTVETEHDHIHIPPAKPVAIVDPTGAGDAYRAGFIAGHLRGFPLETCGKMGAVASVYTVEKYGTVTHEFTKDEFIQRYRDNFSDTFTL
jgi:adenosine kinase